MLSGDANPRGVAADVSQIVTRRSGAAYGSGRSSVASTRAKIALLAPMPSARVAAAISVNAGAFLSCRSANEMSWRSSSIITILPSPFDVANRGLVRFAPMCYENSILLRL